MSAVAIQPCGECKGTGEWLGSNGVWHRCPSCKSITAPPVRRRADEHALYSVEWATPPEVFDPLNIEFGFTLDPAASATNAKAPTFYTREDDGLAQLWAPHVVWLNPPYGRGIGNWLRKAHLEATAGATVVALIPNNTDTAWFHDWVLPYAELRWVRGRVQFIGADGQRRKGNTTGSVIAVYGPGGRVQSSAREFAKLHGITIDEKAAQERIDIETGKGYSDE